MIHAGVVGVSLPSCTLSPTLMFTTGSGRQANVSRMIPDSLLRPACSLFPGNHEVSSTALQSQLCTYLLPASPGSLLQITGWALLPPRRGTQQGVPVLLPASSGPRPELAVTTCPSLLSV